MSLAVSSVYDGVYNIHIIDTIQTEDLSSRLRLNREVSRTIS